MRRFLLLSLIIFAVFSCAKKSVLLTEGPFDAKRDFEKANQLLEEKDYTNARLLLHNIKRKDVEIEYAPLAQLRLADSYLMEDEPELAVEEYRRFLKDYPRHKYASYAQYKIGLSYYDLIDGADRAVEAVEKALEAFRTLQREYPRNPYREDVELKIEYCLKLLADAEFMIGDFYFKKEAYKGALKRFLGLREKYPDYRNMPEVLYKIVVCFHMLGENDPALEYLKTLKDQYPGSPFAEKAVEELSLGAGEGPK